MTVHGVSLAAVCVLMGRSHAGHNAYASRSSEQGQETFHAEHDERLYWVDA
jgi:hypothetical protein